MLFSIPVLNKCHVTFKAGNILHPFCTFVRDCILQINSKLSPVPLGPLTYVDLVSHLLCFRLHGGFAFLIVWLVLAEFLQLGEERHYLTN